MPIYEFKCMECGHEFEEFIKYAKQSRMINSDKIWPLCEKCCGRTIKMMSEASFKVNGFNEENGYS